MKPDLMAAGPPLEALMRRIAEAGSDVLIEPRIGAQGVAPVDAVVLDLFELLGLEVPESLDDFGVNKTVQDRRRLQITLLLTWLCADETLQVHAKNAALLLQMLLDGHLIGTGDTPVDVLDHAHPNNIRQGRMWLHVAACR